ncbi:hypothetical protein QNM97_22520 [Gordonia sp. L191]|uniref:hypothetical protein n=1 Tax=Gordonia sp. L191 TaxID=2982699 RepID=UPI0024C04009|nr:hypothetical protein [Gordonia sp. L191]WHU46718.1 hypothetical protein QNM97_22520 [Gordonia sp. L191]
MVLAQNDPAQRNTAGARDESHPRPLVTLGVGLLLVVLCIATTIAAALLLIGSMADAQL